MHSLTIFIVIITLISLIIFIKWSTQTKETFIDLNQKTQLKSHHEFAIEPCRILANNQISDVNIPKASAFLDADRIKVWKPNNKVINTSSNILNSKTFCYINNDPDNQVQDYIMIDRSCKKTDPLFKDASFITRTFDDVASDRTSPFPLKKCVFEIDNASVTPNALDKFWQNTNVIDCYSRTAPLLAKRKEISAELQTCQGDLLSRNGNAMNAQEQLVAQEAYILKIKDIEDALQKDIDNKLLDIQNAKLDIDKNVNIYKEIEQNTTNCQQEYINQNVWWQRTFDDLTNVYTSTLSSTNVLQEQYDSLIADNCFSQIIQQETKLNQTYQEYTELNTDYKITANRYEQVYDDVQNSQDMLDSCNSTYVVCNSNLPSRYSLLDKVTEETNACTSSLSQCTISLSACQADVDSLTNQFNSCSVNLTDCIKNKSALETLTDQQKKEIAYLRSLLKSCDNVNIDNNQYNLSLNAIQKVANDRDGELQGARNALGDVQWNLSQTIINALKSDMPNMCANTPQIIANKALQDKINNPTTPTPIQSTLPPSGTNPYIYVLADVRSAVGDDSPILTINSKLSTGDCQNLCDQTPNCSLFVFDKGNGGTCYIKGNTSDNPTNDDNMFCVPKTTHITGIKTNLFSKTQ